MHSHSTSEAELQLSLELIRRRHPGRVGGLVVCPVTDAAEPRTSGAQANGIAATAAPPPPLSSVGLAAAMSSLVSAADALHQLQQEREPAHCEVLRDLEWSLYCSAAAPDAWGARARCGPSCCSCCSCC